ncbi:dicarboxylate/amino acid:cation symporter [Acetobacter estunensis]|uniref:dicarboxylate/amino acid:cation symporter n=1 Tax=Acetobacter estunensis TaxID=104097 RepID=UPI001C2CE21C|nr:dicarboxylate/amino acid:cation symporter [Acetobacter estunensis]MBV1837205.1 dicarboxylate/amino acid:cation symporter [Acetobacter estunensis]
MAVVGKPTSTKRRTIAILVALVLGVVCGLSVHDLTPEWITFAEQTGSLLTQIFLRLIRMIIAPLVFATLVSGIGKLGDDTMVLRVGGRVLVWFISMSFLSLLIGLFAAHVLTPGSGFSAPLPADVSGLKHPFQPVEFILHVVPTSILDAMSRNDILQIVVFAVLFGVALPAAGTAGQTMLKWTEELAHVMLRMTDMVMVLAPMAVFGSIMGTLAHSGASVLLLFGRFLAEFYGTILFQWCVLTGITCLFLGRRITGLIREMVQPVVLGFATASSEAVYPLLLEKLENFGVPGRIAGFVLPLGYSFNMDGSILFQSFGALFIAQAYGIQMSWSQQFLMVLVMMLSSKGIAGVPRASLVTLVAVLPQFGLPEAGIALILGIDHFLDMARTATNVLGNGYAAAVSAKWEGVLSEGPAEETL